MREPDTPVVEYQTARPTPQTPKLSVFVVLAIVYLIGSGSGFHVWYYLRQPGFDPAAELSRCGPAGVMVAVALYAIFFKRTWRLTATAVVLSFVLGAITGLAAVASRIYRVG